MNNPKVNVQGADKKVERDILPAAPHLKLLCKTHKSFFVQLNEMKNDRNANIMTFFSMSHIFQFTNGTYKGKMTIVKDFDSY